MYRYISYKSIKLVNKKMLTLRVFVNDKWVESMNDINIELVLCK